MVALVALSIGLKAWVQLDSVEAESCGLRVHGVRQLLVSTFLRGRKLRFRLIFTMELMDLRWELASGSIVYKSLTQDWCKAKKKRNTIHSLQDEQVTI